MVRKWQREVKIELMGDHPFISVQGESLEEWIAAIAEDLEKSIASLKQRVKYLEERRK